MGAFMGAGTYEGDLRPGRLAPGTARLLRAVVVLAVALSASGASGSLPSEFYCTGMAPIDLGCEGQYRDQTGGIRSRTVLGTAIPNVGGAPYIGTYRLTIDAPSAHWVRECAEPSLYMPSCDWVASEGVVRAGDVVTVRIEAFGVGGFETTVS